MTASIPLHIQFARVKTPSIDIIHEVLPEVKKKF